MIRRTVRISFVSLVSLSSPLPNRCDPPRLRGPLIGGGPRHLEIPNRDGGEWMPIQKDKESFANARRYLSPIFPLTMLCPIRVN